MSSRAPESPDRKNFPQKREPNSSNGRLIPNVEITTHFEAAWRRLSPELYRRSLQWMSGRAEDAEDAVAQVAVIALQKIPCDLDFHDTRKWLLRLTYTQCMDLHRARKRTHHRATALDAAVEEVVASAAPSLEAKLLNEELKILIGDCIRLLAPRLRSVAELYLLREMPYPEIAELLALTEENVRKRMQHARSVLREHLRIYLAGPAEATGGSPAPSEPRAGEEQCKRASPSPSRWSIQGLTKYVHRHPRGWKKRRELASRLRESGLLEEAIVHLQEATRRQPRDMKLWTELGETLAERGCFNDAITAYERALRWAHDEVSSRSLNDRIAGCRDRLDKPIE